uniref:Uncharacterized protein n=1 Tax=Anguilla anguilla TaxID=7936 RepID=A0A0E9V4K3_ANGAN
MSTVKYLLLDRDMIELT